MNIKRILSRRRIPQRGLTMLEIMIVIAILGLVMGLVIVPKVMGMFGESQEKVAKLAVTKFASEAYLRSYSWRKCSSGDQPYSKVD